MERFWFFLEYKPLVEVFVLVLVKRPGETISMTDL